MLNWGDRGGNRWGRGVLDDQDRTAYAFAWYRGGIEVPEKRLRIAVLISSFITTGGAERYAVEVSRRLAKDHEVHVFCNRWSFDGTEEITFHKIPNYIKKPGFLGQLFFSLFCTRMVDDAFDIIHSHSRVTRFDVLTLHVPCFKTYMIEEKNRWKRMRILISAALSPRILSWLWLEHNQFKWNRTRLFIAVSEKIKEDLQANYPVPDENIRIAYPGVDTSMAKRGGVGVSREALRRKAGTAERDLVFLFVGTEFKRKGLDALLEGFNLMKSPRTKLLVAGGGGGQLTKYVNLVEKMGLNTHVRFLGLVQNMEELYAIADAFILPTLSDPAGMAPIEAMSAGIPTILSGPEYCGIAELVKQDEAILLRNPKDPVEIATALTRLADEGLRNKISVKGQELASKLTWDVTTANTLSAYYEVLKRKGM